MQRCRNSLASDCLFALRLHPLVFINCTLIFSWISVLHFTQHWSLPCEVLSPRSDNAALPVHGSTSCERQGLPPFLGGDSTLNCRILVQLVSQIDQSSQSPLQSRASREGGLSGAVSQPLSPSEKPPPVQGSEGLACSH